ncbi:hypothetical protein BT67DRAFT_411353 [Trichocladium antarcticum]|uniref:Uncharacterized protein n=1 Tax=Trichocladium antarcticum TaxID=1450529 RepID=A0AAN6UCR8_9PEZI|nr:hypothetical protein BT67DRAFT_411353 [Trichocladium antarcticum]
MESSPLIKAHDHARAAAIATQTSDTTVAISEHAQAAGEFANASERTGSAEALRTLKLLEHHHQRLSELLKLPVVRPSQTSIENDLLEEDEKEGDSQDGPAGAQPSKESSVAKQTPSVKPLPILSHPRYPGGRNLSSSIASNLASARGIRARYNTQPLTPSVSNDQAPGSLEVHPRREGSMKGKPQDPLDPSRKPSWVPPVIKEGVALEVPSSPAPNDDGFSKFYSTFGSLINRLSAPLAFAGLPLVSDDSAAAAAAATVPSEPVPRTSRHRTSASITEPDLSKIYSRATLRSLDRDGHGPNDSFYVVPPSGHTASYASILNHENKEKRRMAASMHRGGANDHDDNDNDHEDEDDFVDARESQAPPPPPMSPTLRKRLGGRSRSDKDLRNVVEELQLQNASLKAVLDKVSRRLHAFELNSQSSHLALAQSLRLQRPGSPLSSSGGGGGGGAAAPGPGPGEEALRRRNRELEEQLADMARRMEGLDKDHLRLQLTVEKYRERWEKLKAGAKARRDAQDQAHDGESSR